MYTTVRESRGAIEASAHLVEQQRGEIDTRDRGATVRALVPLLVDQVMAEAGVIEPRVAARAVDQARGDVARAVSLLRSWVSCLPRLGTSTAGWRDIEVERRITPAVSEPDGGQYLGASLDYAPRLLSLNDTDTNGASARADAVAPVEVADGDGEPLALSRCAERLARQDLIAATEPTEAVDLTRRASAAGAGRGAFQHFLSRAETGALTALAYTAVREGPKQADPTLVELRSGLLPVIVRHPRSGNMVRVGSFPMTMCELVLYHVRVDALGEHADARFTLGYGATPGRVERRAISAALLDARVTRANADPAAGGAQPPDDAEWLITALDGQEATGFVEHLKLAHHVSFASDLDRVRTVGRNGSQRPPDAEA
jgi:alpha-D-ribose 1-methylphosphonate 5-triphosphate synthase subunit PhnI